MYYFFLSVLATGLGLAWVFGTRLGRNGALSFSDASIGLALVPTFIATVTYACYALTSYVFPMRLIVAAAPPTIALALAGFSVLRNKRISVRYREVGIAALLALSFIAALLPFIKSVRVAAVIGQTNHDVSLYLTQASDISRILRDGSDSWMAWAHYAHPDVVTPHSLIFPVYLAWGFLFTDSPGFGSDYMPRLLIGLDHLALLAAIVGLIGRKHLHWGCFAAAIVTFNAIWPSEIRGLSRDTFYIAPSIAVLAILLRAKPNVRPMERPLATAALLLALVGALMGHSLGSLLAGSIAIGAGTALMIVHRGAVFRIWALWITAATLAIAAAVIAIRYVTVTPGEQGFAYPFYVDPFHKRYFANRAFASAANFFELMESLCRTNGIHPLFLLIPAAAGIVLAVRAWFGRGTAGSTIWLAVLGSLLAILALVLLLPLKLDGASLSGAFVANFRYGFPIGVLLLVLLAQSGVIVVEAVRSILERRSVKTFAAIGLAGLLALTFCLTFIDCKSLLRATLSAQSPRAQMQKELCDQLVNAGVRKVLLDNDGMVYRCAAKTAYVFTRAGTLITGAEGSSAIAAALDAQQIDAVILVTAIPTLWLGTHLYSYLEANWQLLPVEAGVTFLRPGLTMPPAD